MNVGELVAFLSSLPPAAMVKVFDHRSGRAEPLKAVQQVGDAPVLHGVESVWLVPKREAEAVNHHPGRPPADAQLVAWLDANIERARILGEEGFTGASRLLYDAMLEAVERWYDRQLTEGPTPPEA